MPYLLQSDRKRPDVITSSVLNSLGYGHEGRISTRLSISVHRRTASMLQEVARYQEAQRLLDQALLSSSQIFGEEDPITASIMQELAALHYQQRNYKEAERFYKSAYAISSACNGPEHPYTILSLQMLAMFYWIGPQWLNDAERLQTEVLLMRERVLGTTHPDTVDSAIKLARVYSAQKHHREAKVLYERAVRICRAESDYDREMTARALRALAIYYGGRYKYRKAEKLYLEAYEVLLSMHGSEHPETISLLRELAALYGSVGKTARGEKILLETSPILARTLGAEHPQYVHELTAQARFYHSQRKFVSAFSAWTQALDTSRRTFGPTHPITLQIAGDLSVYREYQESVVEQCQKRWLPRLKTKKKPVAAAFIGLLSGGIGLGLYFRSLIDFLIPTLLFFIALLISPWYAIFAGPTLSACWGINRAKDSCDDQCQCRAICIQ